MAKIRVGGIELEMAPKKVVRINGHHSTVKSKLKFNPSSMSMVGIFFDNPP